MTADPAPPPMNHIILLGDSIFDNARYTLGAPDVLSQVREILPNDWKASLLAIDGSATQDIPSQLNSIPHDASHLVLSVGGNDAIMNSDILRTPAKSTSDALDALAATSARFEESYRKAVHA